MENLPSLAQMLSQVPDSRQPGKVEHPLTALLLHAILAVLSGCRGPTAMAEWGRWHPELAMELGYVTTVTPCAATFCRLFAALEWTALVAVLRTWAEMWRPPRESSDASKAPPPDPVALDGKTYRGSRKRGGHRCHVLTAVFHELGLVWTESAVDDKTNEIPVAKALLSPLCLRGRVVTMDALLSQREIAKVILDGGGDYVMPIKENHKSVHREIHALFRDAKTLPVSLETAETVEKSRGRLEVRRLTAMSRTDEWGDGEFDAYFDGPGLRQVYRIEREVKVLRTGETSCEVEVGFTSLAPDRVGPDALLAYRRGHWHIENGIHYVRDVTFDEDRSQVHRGNAPQVHGTIRNLAIALCRRHDRTNIARACREIAANPRLVLPWVGVTPS